MKAALRHSLSEEKSKGLFDMLRHSFGWKTIEKVQEK